MKVRYCIGIIVIIVLLAGGISIARTSQVNAANSSLAGEPAEVWVTDYISDLTNSGSHVAIAIDEQHDNTPWIAYYSQTYESLMVAHYVGAGEGNCNANDAWYCEMVDRVAGEVKGLYTSIDIHPDTNPEPFLSSWKVGISYFDEAHQSLRYARYACTLGGDCEWTAQTVDSPADGADTVGKFTSIKYTADGIANISYYASDDVGDFTQEMLKYAYYAGSGNCGDDNNWVCQVIDSAYSTIGTHTSLDLDYEDRVFISYYDGINGALKYAYYMGFGGSCGTGGDWECQFIDERATGEVGLFSSMHARKSSEDYMRIAYYHKTDGMLMYAYDIDGTGNCGQNSGWQCNEIEEIGAGSSQMGISLVVDGDGNPVIAYAAQSSEVAPLSLKIATRAPFETYANCGEELFYSWWCRTVENGGAYEEEAQFVGLGIKTNGLPIIAYSELDTYAYPQEYNLKIAYQAALTLLPLVVK
jgi:hypothetical protein